MASAAAETTNHEQSDAITKIGNLRFCRGCKNLMIVQSLDDTLVWTCSIECPYSQEFKPVPPESTPSISSAAKGKTSKDKTSKDKPAPKEKKPRSNVSGESRLVILSQVSDTDFSSDQNIQNQFTTLDPTLLRTRIVCPNVTDPKHVEQPGAPSEMIVFKQNLVTAKSYYICTVCLRNISIDGTTVLPKNNSIVE